jgi:hypothetical protein
LKTDCCGWALPFTHRYRDFKTFHIEQAKAFKRDLADQRGHRSGELLSKATLYATT